MASKNVIATLNCFIEVWIASPTNDNPIILGTNKTTTTILHKPSRELCPVVGTKIKLKCPRTC